MDRFTNSFNGYNIEEVNNFVDKMTSEYEAILEKLRIVEDENTRLKKELEEKKSSNIEINNLLNEAKINASKIINDANFESQQIELKTEKLKLETTIFIRKLKALLDIEYKLLEDIDNVKIDE